MRYGLHLTLLNVCVHLVTSSPGAFNVTEIAIMAFVQSAMCDNYISCGKEINETNSELVQTFVNGLQFHWPEIPPAQCCRECSCDVASCAKKGTCCPNILDQVNFEDANYFACERAQMRKEGRFFRAENHFYMRSKCHPYYAKTGSSLEVISLCEIRTENKLEIHVPVLDTITNVTYANKYCAQCNFVTVTDGTFPGKGGNLVYWDSSVQCTDANEAPSILAASNHNQGFIKAILLTKTCNVIFKPKPVYEVHTSSCLGAEIDICNATGNKITYDPWLEKACGAYTSTFNVKFKNVFCFLCNNFIIDLNYCSTIPALDSHHIFPEFSSLLAFTPDIRKPPTSQPTGCSSEQVFDEHEETCRDIFCRFPKRFNGSECVNAVDTLDGVSFKLYLKFTPQTPFGISLLGELVVLLESKVTEMLQIWELYDAVYSFKILYNLNENILAPSVLSIAHTFPPDTLTFPPDVPTFRSDVSTFQTDVLKFPSNVPTFPADVPTFPNDVPKLPFDVPPFPPDVPTFPLDVPTFPSDVPTFQPDVLKFLSNPPTFPADVPTFPNDVPKLPFDVPPFPPDVPTFSPDVSTFPPDLPIFSLDITTFPPDLPTVQPDAPTLTSDETTFPPDVATFTPALSSFPSDVSTCQPDVPRIPIDVSTLLPTMYTPLPSTQPNRMPDSVPTIKGNERTSTVAASPETIEYFLVRIEMNLQKKSSNPKNSVTLLDKALEFDETSMAIASTSSRFNVTFNFEFVDFYISDDSNEFEIKMFDPVSGILLSEALPLFNSPLVKATTTSTVLTARFKCPLVVLNLTEINPIENNAFRLKNGAMIDRKYVNYGKHMITNETFEVCWEIYKTYFNGSKTRQTDRSSDRKPVTATGILSLACMIISVTCLLITLVTYFLFNELRTQPGINNMGLTISLIIAQVLFQFGKEQHAHVPSWACEFIGALVHFFWLLVIFWMNVCCWHMFRAFTNMQAISFKQSYVWKTCVYTVYTFVGSLLFVAINITVTVVNTNNADVGYGDGNCYISMLEMVGYTFSLPVLLIILSNLAMFCIVIFKIKRNPAVQSSAESKRNYLTIFAKLSTLTGLSWIFGFIYTYTEISVFVYLFIILCNGQGVLIFISFVCSKRVYNLYKMKLCAQTSERKKTPQSSISMTLTEGSSTFTSISRTQTEIDV
ncbi:adhesion G-protein coupled receptor G2-like [Dreissena polymorpha]|uniref:G-protein coupled receptors family 2 profile 2 domain-containing protein n=1 Tax=Dreissena polymorpha TaxID=45954 RepID=A0A9D4M010_DREPO|nr:adhesion G-protein coupled receptor G2-like [Dreissena polymorpha]KAH3867094.1 hypothetical protein DPMN_030219 [Dreissena polymorpha]